MSANAADAPAASAARPGEAVPASFSTAEVAQRLGVSTPTVQRWVDAGYLKAWKTPGGHRRIDAASAEQLWRAQRQAALASAPTRALEVMIVDDAENDRDLMIAAAGSALPKASLRVFDNGFHALIGIGARMPDVLLTDIAMPHMDGVEMLRQLVASGQELPRLVVVVSAHCDAKGRPRSVLPSGVRFVPKPLNATRLAALLRASVTGG